MKRWWAVVLLLPSLVLAQEQALTSSVAPAVTVSLPQSVAPESVQINYGFRHATGFSGRVLQTRAGVHDYQIRADHVELGPPVSLQLLVQIPGHRVVAAEFTREDLQTGMVFIPPLVALPKTPLKGRLIDSAGNPIANESVSISYVLSELCGWYDLADCMVGFTPPIAPTSTDGNGDFAVTLPALLDDPFFQDTRTPGFFRISTGRQPVSRNSTLLPEHFALQKTYEPLTIRRIRSGTVAGILGQEFLKEHLLEPKDLTVYVRTREAILAPIPTITASEMRNPKRGAPTPLNSFTGVLKPDGRFELQVPAGKYDVHLWISAQSRFIPIRQDVVVPEDERVIVVQP